MRHRRAICWRRHDESLEEPRELAGCKILLKTKILGKRRRRSFKTVLQHKPTMFTRSPEGRPYPGLHQEKHGQQGKGGDPAPLLCSGETPPGVLCPSLKPSAQDRPGAVGAGPEEAAKMIRRLEHLWGKAERVGFVQPEEGMAPGRPYSSFQVPEGTY